jgi:sigma-B regulation protein RsbU (phosphoserine phosphatase)
MGPWSHADHVVAFGVSFPFARKLLLVVGGSSILLYLAIFAAQARMGRLVALDLLERFAEDFLGGRAAQVDSALRSAEAVAQALADGAPRSQTGGPDLERSLCGALVAPIREARLVWNEAGGPGADPARGWACALDGAARRFAALTSAEDLAVVAPAWVRIAGREGVVSYSIPLFDGEGQARRVRGSVQVDLATDNLGQLVESLRPKHGSAFLVTGAGDALIPPAAGLETIVSRVLAEPGSRGQYVGPFPGQSGASWIGYRRLRAPGWWLVEAVPEDAVLRDLDTLRLRLLALMLFGALALLLLTAGLARGITRPIRSLSASARRIADGDLESPAPAIASRDEVGDLARSFEGMRVALRAHIDEVARLASARARMEGDLKVAREIQLGLLPTDFADITRGHASDLFALVVPAREVGGDLYDVFRIGDRHLWLVLGDVSGKGLPASLFMTAARTLFRALAQNASRPAELMARVNDALAAENPRSMFVTAFCAVVDLVDGRVAFANAGHLAPAILPCSGPARFGPEVPGLPLGLMPGAAYDAVELRLAPGDTLLLYTDGVTEAFDISQALFGPERLLARLDAGPRASARETVEDVLAGVRAFAGEAAQSDDIGLLALRWDGPSARP